jgi:hypothetical protein
VATIHAQFWEVRVRGEDFDGFDLRLLGCCGDRKIDC